MTQSCLVIMHVDAFKIDMSAALVMYFGHVLTVQSKAIQYEIMNPEIEIMHGC